MYPMKPSRLLAHLSKLRPVNYYCLALPAQLSIGGEQARVNGARRRGAYGCWFLRKAMSALRSSGSFKPGNVILVPGMNFLGSVM
jgi:hypothetical protein